jgi:maltodextrin utilization protein YvdJ
MARDVLSIHISIVASKSTFSVGGRVIDQYRSLLKPDIVEALVCTRDWLFEEKGNICYFVYLFFSLTYIIFLLH